MRGALLSSESSSVHLLLTASCSCFPAHRLANEAQRRALLADLKLQYTMLDLQVSKSHWRVFMPVTHNPWICTCS